jgi:hypothetical protein
MTTLAAVLALAATACAQDAALRRAADARLRCETLLGALEGVTVVGLGGSREDYRILVTCKDPSARAAARALAGGDTVDGVKILWTLAPKDPPKPAPQPPKLQAPSEEPAPQVPPWKAEATDCDIVRDYLKLKPVNHPAGQGRSYVPCQLVRRSVTGAGGGHSYTYTKHRPDCPIRLGRVAQPAWADSFIAWVFQKGFTPVARAGITWPYELRADDKLWDQQAAGELMTRLPYIREGAEWETATGQYVKVRTPWFSGWLSTGGWPGLGWTWRDPAPLPNPVPPVPTK